MNEKCIFLAGNSYIDLRIIDSSSLIDKLWSVHDNLCGNDNFPVIVYKNDPLYTDCIESWKLNTADWTLFGNLCLKFFFYIRKILTYHLHISIANKYLRKTSIIFQKNFLKTIIFR